MKKYYQLGFELYNDSKRPIVAETLAEAYNGIEAYQFDFRNRPRNPPVEIFSEPIEIVLSDESKILIFNA
jgi:hypothetical protein